MQQIGFAATQEYDYTALKVTGFFYTLTVITKYPRACGSGKITKVLRERYPKAQIMGIDLNLGLLPEGANQAIMADFLDFKDGEYDLIITNPPYSAAEPIITHTLKTWPNATVVMLLRLNFLGSQKRKPFWDKHPVSELHILSKRPSFTGGGTDATEYAWFVWRPGVKEQKINVVWGE